MTEQQESSSFDKDIVDNIQRNIDRDNITELPFVDAMTTPFQSNSIRAHAATLRKLKEQEREIKEKQRQIEELTFGMNIKEAQIKNLHPVHLRSHHLSPQALKLPDLTDSS